VAESSAGNSILAVATRLMGSVCLLLWVSSASATTFRLPTVSGEARQAEVLELMPGQPIERELAGGEAHAYRFTLAKGHYLKAVVKQNGVDVVVRIIGREGQKLTEVDNDPAVGLEAVHVVAEAPGEHRLEVESSRKDAKTGRYEIRIEALRESTSQDRFYVAVQKAFEEGNRLQDQKTAESLRKAREKYEEVLPLWQEVGDKRAQAYTLNKIGYVCATLSEPKKALEYYHQAVLLWREVGDRLNEATALTNIGMSYWRLGDSQKALEYHRQALPLARAVGNREGEASVLNNIGTAYGTLSQLQEALNYFNQVLPLAQIVGDRRLQAVTLSNIGVIHLQLGELQQALEAFNQLLPLRRGIGDRRGEAATLHNLGRVYAELGEFQKALQYYDQSLVPRREVGDRQNEAVTLQALSSTFLHLGEIQKALAYSSQALALSRAVGDRRQEAYVLNDLGKIYKRLGESKNALEQFEQSLSLTRAVGNRQLEIYILNNIGDSYVTLGDPQKALEYHRLSLQLSREIGNRIEEAACLYGIARAQSQLGDRAKARTEIEAALDLIESTRTKVASQELRSTFLASNKDFYEFYIELLMQMHRHQPSAGHHTEALQVSERARARSLLEILAESRADIRQGADVALLERERTLQQQLSVKSERLTRLLSSKHTEEQAAEARKDVAVLLDESQDIEAQIRAKSPRYAALTQPQPLSVKEIQQQVLDQETLLLEYSLGEDRSYLWAVSATAISASELPKRTDIELLARRVHELLTARNQQIKFETPEKRRNRVAKADAEYFRAAITLSKMLLGPVKEQMKNKRLLIVADGVLQYIPFAALPSPEEFRGAKPSKLTPLIASHEVVSLPSASTLGVLRRELAGHQPAPKIAAVLADPVFDRDDERVKISKAKTGPVTETMRSVEGRVDIKIPGSELIRSVKDFGFTGDELYFPRLPSTRREAEAIVAVAPPAYSRKVIDFAASKTNAKDAALGQYKYIHFATHALINSAHPELSGIVLSLVDQQGTDQDGFLLLHEIYNLKLPAEMVVLSSCKTGLGKEIKGEGLVGLTRGFMYAGAARVVVSLWDINDESTAELMSRLYRRLLGKQRLSPAAALRAAQLSVWKSRHWQAPYYWAGFVLQGEYQ
jgi:CHAT domain-containing protein/Tfp pilus assembly protein PilF